MINRIKTTICLALGVLLTACYDGYDFVLVNEVGATATGDYYLSLNINVPEGKASRAGSPSDEDDENAGLAHGDENEYEIYNAYLMLFVNETEDNASNAKFCDVYELYNPEQTVPPGQITHISSRYIIENYKLEDFKYNPDYHYYGVILANVNPEAIRIDLNDKDVKFRNLSGNFPDANTISKTETCYYDEANQNESYATYIQNKRKNMKFDMMLPMSAEGQSSNYLSIVRNNKRYLTMSNAMLFPVVNASTGGKGIQEAVSLTGKIKPKPATDPEYASEKWPEFYLERLAAKVEVTDATTGSTYNDGTTTYHYALKLWCLANVSPCTYVMRHGDMQWADLESSNSSSIISTANRFSSYSHIESESTPNDASPEVGDLYRGYFCESTEYLKSARSEWGKYPEKQFAKSGTEVTIPAADHYGGKFYAQGWNSFGSFDYCHENTMKVWRMMVKNATHVVVEVKFWTGDTEPEDNTPEANLTVGTTTYTNGRAYYIIPISHFGNEYTPWRKGESETPSPILLPYPTIPLSTATDYETKLNEKLEQEIENIKRTYPGCRSFGTDRFDTHDQDGHMSGADANYLGRWGVVRNNWYKISITEVKGFGLAQNPIQNPTIITEDPTPLDYYENMLSATVQVNNWKVRDQSVILDFGE